MPVTIKICGIRDRAILDEAINLSCAYAGLIFFPASPRNINVEEAAGLAAHGRGRIKTVAVVVDAEDALLTRIAQEVHPDFLQLHGHESAQRMQDIKTRFNIPLICAVKVRDSNDVLRANAYANSADMLLFDARPPVAALPGGNGLAFDWRLLAGHAIPLPWFLSGGLNAQNAAQALQVSGVRLVDISSGVESAPGVKDTKLMRAFVRAVREAEKTL